ncbi:four-jointed box protein 1 [Polyodon spathula]|uniref:four-jointed box protein 1 n=1 Tax=Polyodon spathula TaxID=7913 RepID=UPI001B7E092E|nr:four-jointed box protein 1 [Polyodon spathula]
MRIALARSLAVFFLCACTSLLYVWTGLVEIGHGRSKRTLGTPGAAVLSRQSDKQDPKTFRALLEGHVGHKPRFSARKNMNNHTAYGSAIGNLKVQQTNLDTHNTNHQQVHTGLHGLVEDGVFWSDRLESLLPSGFSNAHAQSWKSETRSSQIVSLEKGCGRTSNRLARFSNGTKACVRYGINPDQVQGETLSYYLASLLGISNVPPLVLSQVNPNSEQWTRVRGEVMDSQWSEKAVVSLTEWVANLTGVVTPAPLRQEGRRLHPLREDLDNRTIGEVLELVQWTDLILFDYLTANFDRLVSNVFSLQWDSRVMERDTSNLHKIPNGGLVFIDNEAGLVHGYRVLEMWQKYHDTLLSSVCLFRKITASRIFDMHRRQDAAARLLILYRDSEPLAPELGFLSEDQAGILQNRVDQLYKHILNCKEKYSQF